MQLKIILSINICLWSIKDSANVWYLSYLFILDKSVSDSYKNQEMCNKAVDNYPHSLEFVPECYKTQKMCDKAVDKHPTTIKYVPDSYNSA